MDGRNYEDFFLHPQDATQRRYEALRAVCVEGESAADVADSNGHSTRDSAELGL